MIFATECIECTCRTPATVKSGVSRTPLLRTSVAECNRDKNSYANRHMTCSLQYSEQFAGSVCKYCLALRVVIYYVVPSTAGLCHFSPHPPFLRNAVRCGENGIIGRSVGRSNCGAKVIMTVSGYHTVNGSVFLLDDTINRRPPDVYM